MAKSNADEVGKQTQNIDVNVKSKEIGNESSHQTGTVITASNTLSSTATAPAPGNPSEVTSLDCLIKHPLQNQWTLWYYENEKGKNWELCQHQIASFDTVEDFWSLFNHIKLASEIKSGNDYSLFKNGIRPMWEDDTNKNGGRWVISLGKFYRTNELDNLWLELVLCLIGDAFEYSEDICGAVVNIRPRGHKIAIWTANNNKHKILSIGKKLKESLALPQEMLITYEFHKETAFNRGNKAPAYSL